MAKKEYRVLRWLEETHTQSTPLLFIGERVSRIKLEKGMMIYKIDYGEKYRLDDLSFDNERDERNGVYRMLLTSIDTNGVDGKQRIGSSVNSWLAAWKADIPEEYQELFYADQHVDGKVVDGMFAPADEYLIDWCGMFMKYLDILDAHPYNGQTRIDREMPRLMRRCIQQFGVGVFNAMIRDNYADKEMSEAVFQEAWYNIFESDWIYNIDKRLSFPNSVLRSVASMSTHFEDAVRTVVFKQGVKLDIAKLMQR